MDRNLSLLADVGGTNTRVALSKDGDLDRGSVRKLRNIDFGSLEELLASYVEDEKAQPTRAALAVAGPVRGSTGELTNLSWDFDEAGLAQATGIPRVYLLNDLQAQGYALGSLDDNAVTKIVSGSKPTVKGQTKIVIGVGTGFNAAPVFTSEIGRLVAPSECGHTSLPQDNEEQRRVGAWLTEKLGFASVEDALSGRGLPALYQWAGQGPDAMGGSSEAILAAAYDQTDRQAEMAVRMFVQFLGATAGNLALTQLPFGGVYLIGGMARAMAPFFDRFEFEQSFTAKGRFEELLKEFSVFVVEDDFAALLGCASFLSDQRQM